MRTTLNIDDDLLVRAAKLTGVEEKTYLVRLGLEALIALESARRLARLGGDREGASTDTATQERFVTVLVDTSVWIDHLRRTSPRLVDLLNQGAVAIHPYVVGELACGNLRKREEILRLLRALPENPVVEHEEALRLLETEKLQGRGLGWIDIHLLASARLQNVRLWSLDKALVAAAEKLGIADI